MLPTPNEDSAIKVCIYSTSTWAPPAARLYVHTGLKDYCNDNLKQRDISNWKLIVTWSKADEEKVTIFIPDFITQLTNNFHRVTVTQVHEVVVIELSPGAGVGA